MSDSDRPALASAAVAAAASGRSGPVWGALWMLGGTTCFAIMAVGIRLIADYHDAIDIAFFRSVLGTLFLLPFMLRGQGKGMFRSKRHGLLGLRAVLTYIAMATYFYAIANMSIVDAVALNATIPLFTVALAAVLLPEVVGMRRWVATAIGLAGALIILRPGFQDIGLAATFALGSAAFYGAAGIVVKMLSNSEPPTRIVFYMNLYLVIVAAVPYAIWGNLPTDPYAIAIMLAISVSSTLAHVCITHAYGAADASFIAPFDFWRLVLIVIAGWMLFDDPGSVWTWIGSVVVFGTAAYITRREAQIASREKAAAASAGPQQS